MKREDTASPTHSMSVPRVLVLTLFLVILAYNFVVWVADLNSLVLNLALFAVPLLIGLFSPAVRILKPGPLVISSALLALAAVTFMSVIALLHGIWAGYDDITILPRNEQELAQDLQDIYLIAAGLIVGALLPLAVSTLRAGFGSINRQKLVSLITFIVNVVGPLLILAVKIAREWLRQ